MSRSSTKISFDNGRGKKLSGIIDSPTEIPIYATAVIAPCFTCVKESNGAAKISRALAERGIATLRFDTIGVGESAGDQADTDFSSRIADIVAACHALPDRPRILIGHSISGTAGISAMEQLSFIDMLATVCSPSDPRAVIEKFRAQGLMDESGDGDIAINVLGASIPFRRSFVSDLLSHDVEAVTRNLQKPVLVFHAPADRIVSYSNAETIAARAPQAELIRMADTATHLFEKGSGDAEFVADVIVARLKSIDSGG
jgi:putative redox protein